MSKNLTRKGLALGAIVALGSSLFAGTAANAADEVTLAPSAGTLYKTIEGETFSLLGGLASSVPAGNVAQLKYNVVTTATLTVYADTTAAGTTAATAVTAGQPTNTTVYKKSVAPVVGDANYLNVKLTTNNVAAGTPATAVVTAFLDSNNNNILDAGEYVSGARTVTFVDVADVVATVSLTQPSEGDTGASATVSLADINQEQISQNHLAVYFTKGDGTALTGSTNAGTYYATSSQYAGTNLVTPAALSSGAYKATIASTTTPSTAITALGATGSVKAAAYYLATGAAITSSATTTGASSGVSGGWVTASPAGNTTYAAASGTYTASAGITGSLLGSNVKAITARTIASVTASAVASATNKDSVAGLPNTVVNRLNSEFKVKANVADASSVAVAGATVKAVVTLTGTAAVLGTTSTSPKLTVNGTEYTSSSATGLTDGVTLTSDANGDVFVTLKTANFVVANTLTVTFTAQGLSSVIVATSEADAWTLVQDRAISSSVYRTVTKGGNYVPTYTLVNQFKQVPSSGNYRLKTTATAGAGVAAGDTYAALTAGKGSVTYATSATGSFTVAAAVEVQDATTGNWSAQAATAPATVTVTVIDAETDAVTATSSSSTTAVAVASTLEKAIDTRLSFGSAASYNSGDATTISGTVSNSLTGVARSGAAVTIASPGLLFSTVYNGTVFTADSITVFADNSGAYSVVALSNIAGTFTVTVTAEGATKTATAKFATSLAPASVSVKVADGAAQFQAGRALDVVFTVVDKYSNPVTSGATNSTNAGKLTIAQTGSGYLAATGDVVATNGVYTTKLITNAGDLGTSTITATLDLATDVVKTVSSEFGVTDADVTVGGRAIYASVEFGKGKTVTVSVDGKRLYSKLQSSDAYTELKFTQKTAGKHTVVIRISGGVSYSETVTTTK